MKESDPNYVSGAMGAATLPLLENGTVRGACPHDCPDTCALITTVENGRATRIQGDPNHPVTQGFLCSKVNRYLDRTYHHDRLTYPMRRVGPKGRGKFERVTWDEALTDIAARLKQVIAEHGGEAVLPYSYAGTMGYLQGESMDRRFFHTIGASKLDRTICSTAGAAGMRMTVGANIGADTESVGASDFIMLWGTNTLTANPHLWPFILEAKEKGAPVICIDPIRTRTARQCDEWIPIRPGTDAALALGIAHVLFAEGLTDEDFLANHTLGADQMRERAAEWPPARVSETTGIPVETIVSLARRYGRARNAFIRVNYGLQRHAGGGMAVRTIACLPAITGHWRNAGGGVQLSTSKNFAFNVAKLHRVDAGPATRTINMIRLGDALTLPDAGVGGPPVKALVVYNSNPGAVAPDLNAVRRGLGRDDLFTVVLEHFQTDTADWADYVLPATTQLEHWDVHFAYGHHYATLNRPAIAPIGEARPNTEIFRGLAKAMGLTQEWFTDDDQTLIRQALDTDHERMKGVTFDALLENGWVRLNIPRPYAPFGKGEFLTPSGKCEFYSERLAQMGFDPLPTYIPPYESPERDPSLMAQWPLTLISSPAHQFLNSTFVNVDPLRRAVGKPECIIHPDDAAPRDIKAGDEVEIRNGRGSFKVIARVEESIKRGVVWAPSIWWTKLSPDGCNANETTSQRETDLGGGATFYDNQVEVSPA
jgi:anaerobic selenocysteine-containing dehydrogenase